MAQTELTLSRRGFLAALSIAGLKISGCYSSPERVPPARAQTVYDYYFIGESHGETPISFALDHITRHHIPAVALEGLPQGEITSRTFTEMREREEPRRAEADAFGGQLEQIIAIGDVSDQIRPDEELRTIEEAKYELQIIRTTIFIAEGLRFSVSDLATLFASQKKEYGPGYQYCAPLLERGVRIKGMEDMHLFQETLQRCFAPTLANDYHRIETLLRARLAQAAQVLDDERGRHILSLLERKCETLRERGIQAGLIEANGTHDPSLNDRLRPYKESVMIRQRTEVWMDYLRNEINIGLISGSAHVPIQEELARQQRKSYLSLVDEGSNRPSSR